MNQTHHSVTAAECGCHLQDTGVVRGLMLEKLQTTAPTAVRRCTEVTAMPKVLTNGKIKAGAYRFSDKRRIALCVEEGNAITICGYFTSEEHAKFFMDKVAECIGQKVDCGGKNDAEFF